MNKVIMTGNLTRDPELMETVSGTMLCKMSIAVNRSYVNEDGSRDADFFNVTAWRNLAENCAKYLKKGNKIALVGELRSRTYEDEHGTKHYVTEIVATDIEFLTPKVREDDEEVKDTKKKSAKAKKVTKKATKKDKLEEIDDDQLPF